jgi:UDP-glucose 4-epimerase
MFLGKSFLITGGTGSFGTTLTEFLLGTDVSRIVIFSRDETKQHLLKAKYSDSRVEFYLGDIRNEYTTAKILEGIEYVFHAAALKQVPTGENFPFEYIQTNIIGSHNLLSSLKNTDVEKVVFLSTDKAVYPVNVMGITKAMMEKLVRSENYPSQVTSVITRYGNVIGSRGSVIPEFINSAVMKGSVDITDKTMTRFMMSLQDSVNLVLYALNSGENGDLFVQKSPAATIEVLVQALELILEKEIKQNFIGIRKGEKIHETLLTAEEHKNAIETKDYFQVPNIKNTNDSGSKNNTDYSSNTTIPLTPEELASLLLSISEIKSLLR